MLSSSLSQEINVSEDTIRRDLQELADEGKVLKYTVARFPLFQPGVLIILHTISIHTSRKNHCTAKAAALIQDGMFVLTTGGTTILEMAHPFAASACYIYFGRYSGGTGIYEPPQYRCDPDRRSCIVKPKITVGGEAIAKIADNKATQF